MPRTDVAAPAATALTLLDDETRADLLRAQSEQVTTFQRLPRIKIMGQGAGLYEFADGSSRTEREFVGIILNSHPRNILWDRPIDPAAPRRTDEDNAPACTSADGKTGTPRVGFVHVMLNRPALGTERIDCATCRYNAWNSAGLTVPARAGQKGKAVTNQRSIYILVEGSQSPYELTLTPSSLQNYDAFLVSLSNQSIPVQAVLTRFSQEVKTSANGSIRWGQAKFANAGLLDGETFQMAMGKRREYMRHITPSEYVVDRAVEAELATGSEMEEDAPF